VERIGVSSQFERSPTRRSRLGILTVGLIFLAMGYFGSPSAMAGCGDYLMELESHSETSDSHHGRSDHQAPFSPCASGHCGQAPMVPPAGAPAPNPQRFGVDRLILYCDLVAACLSAGERRSFVASSELVPHAVYLSVLLRPPRVA
jgi:hypothetical protein